MLHAVKMAEGADDILEGLGIPYGGPHNGKDIEGEAFTKSTDLCTDWFGPGERPLLYHHGLDNDAGTSVVGRVADYKATDKGVWTKVQLDRQSDYFDAIKELVDQGKLFFSSGAMAHLVRRKKSGEITRWPWVELSLTPTPANLLAEVDFETAEKHFDAAGVKSATFSAIKAMSESSDTSGGYDVNDNSVGASGKGDFAYVDSNGRGHLPIHDAAHVRAALARFNQTQFESDSAKQSAKRKINAAAAHFGIEVSKDDNASKSAQDDATKALPTGPTVTDDKDGGPFPEGSYEDLSDDIRQAVQKQSGGYPYVKATMAPGCQCPGYAVVGNVEGDDDDATKAGGSGDYRIAYKIGEDGEPQLGEMEKVNQAYMPARKAYPFLQYDEAPLAIKAARLSEFAALLAVDTEGLLERRTKEGRVLSSANRQQLSATADALKSALEALNDLLSATEPQPAKAASEDRTAELLKLRRQRDYEVLKLFGDLLDPAA